MRFLFKTLLLSLSIAAIGTSMTVANPAQAEVTQDSSTVNRTAKVKSHGAANEYKPKNKEKKAEASTGNGATTETEVEAIATPTATAPTILNIAASEENFSTLVAAATAADLTEVLSGEGLLTVFAPTNAAFEALPDGLLETLLLPENKDLLTKILAYHVVGGSVTSDQLEAGAVTTVEGSDIDVAIADGNVMVNDANVVMADIAASNGVIHVIDRVIIPPAIMAALTQAETEAMESPEPEANAAMTEEMAATAPTIVDIAASEENFSTLVAAVKAADLTETLSGEGPFTVFAPTNAAFEALPDGLLETLLLQENKELLTQVLTYHVVGGNVTSDQLVSGPVTTAEGSDIDVAIAEDGVTVNDANVIMANIPASNGVIHVIDRVIIPPSLL